LSPHTRDLIGDHLRSVESRLIETFMFVRDPDDPLLKIFSRPEHIRAYDIMSTCVFGRDKFRHSDCD
jgi:hypothetical protein